MNIKVADIIDKIDEFARTCKVTTVPTTLVDRPTAEFAFPQDTETETVTSIRPNGAIMSLSAAYNGNPSHEIYRGNIEFMDDTTDPDLYEFHADLSQMPIGHPHRRRYSFIFNNLEDDVPDDTALTNHKVLQKICDMAGIVVGRIDLPVVSVVGTLEIINQSPVEVAAMFCEPFNIFEFQHYFVRCDQNGLQILLVDYGDGGVGSGPAYRITNAKSVKRTYEMYMPDNRIGQADRFLTGANTTGGIIPQSITRNTFHTFYSSSRDTNRFADYSRWSETYTTMELLIEVDGNTVVPIGSPLQDYISVYDPGKIINSPTFGQPPQLGFIENIQIKETFVQKTDTYNYDDVVGLISSRHTYNTYEDKSFVQGSVYTEIVTKRVLTYTETVEYSYPGGAFGVSLERKWFHYSQAGDVQATTTYRYFGIRGSWVLQDVIHDWNDNVDLTTAGVLFFANSEFSQLYQQSAKKAFDIAQKQKARLGKYQLYNGEPFFQYEIRPHLFYTNKGLTTDIINTSFAFTRNIPYMNYDGLRLIDDLILRQKRVEEANPYWENITVLAPADFTPVVGVPVVVAGSGGVCLVVSHHIDENTAETTVQLRRLISLTGVI